MAWITAVLVTPLGMAATSNGPPAMGSRVACVNVSDCRAEFQAALDRGGEVVLPARPGDYNGTTYVIREPGLWPRSDTLLRIEPGVTVEAARGAFVEPPPGVFDGDALNMIVIKDVSNVSISGYGATIRMWKQDYNSMAIYKPPSSSRMGIIIRNCSDVHISGLTVSHTGGDGESRRLFRSGVRSTQRA